MKEKALELAREILVRRLEAAGIKPGNPDAFFQLEAGEPEPYSGGTQIRVHTFRKWSDAHVKLDADTGDPLSYRVDRLSDPPTEKKLTQEEALALVMRSMQIPPEAELLSFSEVPFAAKRQMVELVWNHIHMNLRVEGDLLRVVMHPETGRIVEWERYWRTVQF